MALTKKMRAFVDAFCSDPSVGKAEAARMAGYTATRAQVRACELMKHPDILKEIERRTTQKLDRAELTKETVINELLDVIEACKQAGAGAWQMQNRIKAAELLGKYLKMFTDKVEVGADDELMNLLLEGRKRARLQSAEEIKVEIIRAKLPAKPEQIIDGKEGGQGGNCKPN